MTGEVSLRTDHRFGRMPWPICGPSPTEVTTVADSMIRFPKTCQRTTTVCDAREMFRDDHVHALLVVTLGVLVTVVERSDIDAIPPMFADQTPIVWVGRKRGRTVAPDAELYTVWSWMRDAERRRLAVVDECGTLLGLLCLKRSGAGFCSDAGVQARADERRR